MIQEDVKREAEIAEKVVSSIDAVAQIGEQTPYQCPDCGGGLWHIKNDKTQDIVATLAILKQKKI